MGESFSPGTGRGSRYQGAPIFTPFSCARRHGVVLRQSGLSLRKSLRHHKGPQGDCASRAPTALATISQRRPSDRGVDLRKVWWHTFNCSGGTTGGSWPSRQFRPSALSPTPERPEHQHMAGRRQDGRHSRVQDLSQEVLRAARTAHLPVLAALDEEGCDHQGRAGRCR